MRKLFAALCISAALAAVGGCNKEEPKPAPTTPTTTPDNTKSPADTPATTPAEGEKKM